MRRQSNFLKAPLPPGPGKCHVCRGYARAGYELCYRCDEHVDRSQGLLADAVVPIAYKITQHSHNLWAYKQDPPVAAAQMNLSSLLVVFLREHYPCLEQAAGGSFTCRAIVPSTRGRRGPHPINALWPGGGLPLAVAQVNPKYGLSTRDFHTDWFGISEDLTGERVLLIEDTWTTGSRVQSLAHALKSAGATSVVTVVLGRHINPDTRNNEQLIKDLKQQRGFDIGQCTLDRHTTP